MKKMKFNPKAIRKYRLQKGWTVQRLRDEIMHSGVFVSYTSILNYERGRTEPDATILVAISTTLGVELKDLYA